MKIHTTHIALDSETGRLLKAAKQYVLRYSDKTVSGYFRAEIFEQGKDGKKVFSLLSKSEADGTRFIAGVEDSFFISEEECFEVPLQHQEEYLKYHFSDIFNTEVSVADGDNTPFMSLCLYVPIYKETYWNTAKQMIDAVKAQKCRYRLDLLLIPYDLAFMFEEDKTGLPERLREYRETSIRILDEIVRLASLEQSIINNILLVQNANSLGASLNLDEEKFARIIGELVLMCIQHYESLFNPATKEPGRPLSAIGLSVLNLDKYHFIQYLLHKAYIHILDRENVCQSSVDINKVSKIVQDRLKGRMTIFSEFFKRHIVPCIENNEDQNSIISRIKPEIEKEIQELSAEFQSFIEDPALSLPEKKAALAQLLGEDDELLEGYIFNKGQLTIDDCYTEIIDIFTTANNSLLENSELHEYAALSKESGEHAPSAAELMRDIKSVKTEMKEASNYIRQKSKELEGLALHKAKNEEAKKRLTEDGFIYEGNLYKLEGDIAGPPLEETYESAIHEPYNNIDLRKLFTPVKNQGKMGACTTFALASIYEFILKKNGGKETDLSERFLYYNIRKAAGQEDSDTGCSYYDAVRSLGREGICLERFFPYSDTDLDGQPPQDAYEDALSRKVLKAKNVKISLHDIKCAISEGYPVAISLQIFNSFSDDNGFISRPSEDEITSGKGGWHAMTVCGYSDSDKIFIVRNSWGSSFGDDGYCYIPYSYMADERCLRTCCIITEISGELKAEGGIDSKLRISFDTTDVNVKSAIIKNLINEERYRLADLNSIYSRLTREWNSLIQTLGRMMVRNDICEGTVLRLGEAQKNLNQNKSILLDERLDQLEKLKKDIAIKWASLAGAYVVVAIIYAVIYSCTENGNIFWHWSSCVVFIVLIAATILISLLTSQTRRKIKDVNREYKEMLADTSCQIDTYRREAGITDIKMHIAGLFIDSLHNLSEDLHTKYSSMTSFVGNLSTWRKEEQKDRDISTLCSSEPFISVLDNGSLERFFNARKDEITAEIKLYELFKDKYRVDEESIIAFKNNLKSRLVHVLSKALDSFSMFSYLTGKQHYNYVEQSADLGSIFSRMDSRSEIFVRLTSTADMSSIKNSHMKMLMMDVDLSKERSAADKMITGKFSELPAIIESPSRFKMTLVQTVRLEKHEVDL